MAEQSLLGVGIYSVPEAARYSGVHPARIRRWLKGYKYKRHDQLHYSTALWKSDIPIVDSTLALSFRDLVEVMFVSAFRQHGVSWKELREAAAKAAEKVQSTHPFSTKKFKTDGKRILEEIAQETGSSTLLELVRGQYAIEEIVGPYLADEALEFATGRGGELLRWFPLKGSRRVVLDPKIQFGRPVVLPGAVRTSVLARSAAVEKSVERVALWYDVDKAAVKDAILYENRLAA